MFIQKNYKKLSLENLILLSQKNDYKALKEIIQREEHKIHLTFYYLCPDCDNLSDLTQEALLRMSRGLKNLKNPHTFRGWLNRIISNIFYDNLRKKSRCLNCISTDEEKENAAACEICDPCPCPDENAINHEVSDIIKEMIIKLPDTFRLVTILREVAGMSYEEISKMTGTEIGTVKSRISRARAKLRECLKPYICNN